MDQGQPLVLPDLPVPEPKTQKTETINGQPIPVGTLEQFHQKFFKKSLKQALELKHLVLGIEKFAPAAGKQYRLVWLGREKWLAAEDATPYRTRARAVAAGVTLAAATGAHFNE